MTEKNRRNPLAPLLRRWRTFSRWRQAIICIVLAVVLLYAQGYVIADWYIWKHQNEPLNIGATFISDYAKSYGLDPKQTLAAAQAELGIHRYRLVSYWEDIESTKGTYDFSDLDWQFDQIDKDHGSITLAIGLRQPRWPECHMPSWAKQEPTAQWSAELKTFMGKVIERYKNRPSLVSYQLENEFFLKVFGQCTDFNRDRLIDEFTFVKQQDNGHPIILSLSNNYFGTAIGDPKPDQVGVSVYKRVWEGTITKRYFEYPFTPRYYAYRAGLTELLTGKTSMLHELQAEAWPPVGNIKDTSIAEQNKSLDAIRLKDRIQYGVDTGMRDIDLWGLEWWYWRKEKQQDPSLWFAVKDALKTIRAKQPTE
jgi:hypothetical protein